MEKKLANTGPETTYIEMLPFIGMTIYIPDSIYIHRGCDDIQGGKATISEIHYSDHLPQDHISYCMVKMKETGGKQYNWVYLMRNQEEYERVYGNQIAKPDPDYSLESNPPNGGWSYFV